MPLTELVLVCDFDEGAFRDVQTLWTALVVDQTPLRLQALRALLPTCTVLRVTPTILARQLLEDGSVTLAPGARLQLLPRALRVVCVLDVSSSLSALTHCGVVFERLYDALRALLLAWCSESSSLRIHGATHTPSLHLSLVAQSYLFIAAFSSSALS